MGAVPGSRALRLVLVVSLALCGMARLARAQEKASPTEARRREASEHVQRGDAFKESGRHAAAAREYQKAYALVPHPVLIFNLAQVYRLAGDRERAIEHYERYLAADPSGRASRQARQFADQLRRELERERTGAQERRARSEPAPAGTTTVSRSAQRPSPGRGLRLAGMASAGAGLVAMGFGVKFGLDARGISDDIDAHTDGEWPEELLARQADGERAERNMFILTGAGAAAFVAGGVLYYFGHRARREGKDPAVAVTPVTGGGLGLLFSGEF
jgi:tetratricopeptide (TPR) repeat protein